MILSDSDLQKALELKSLVIEPFLPERVQPASIDLTLGRSFSDWHVQGDPPMYLDLEKPLDVQGLSMHTMDWSDDGYHLQPGKFALATTVEKVTLGPMFCARVEGRSSLGRLGLCVHATAGFIDPGFSGQITLELYNMSPHVFILRPGMSVCQLAVQLLTRPAERPYGWERGSKYMDQTGATPSRWRGSAKER